MSKKPEDEKLTDCKWCGHHTLSFVEENFPYTPDHWSCSFCNSTYADNDGEPVESFE